MSGNQQREWSDDDLNLTGAICSSAQRVFERVHARVDRMRVWGRDTGQLSDCGHRWPIPGVARLGPVVHPCSLGLRLSWVALMGACEDWAVAHGYDRVTLCAYRDVSWKAPTTSGSDDMSFRKGSWAPTGWTAIPGARAGARCPAATGDDEAAVHVALTCRGGLLVRVSVPQEQLDAHQCIRPGPTRGTGGRQPPHADQGGTT